MGIPQLPEQWEVELWPGYIKCIGEENWLGLWHGLEIFVRTQRSGNLKGRFKSIPRVLPVSWSLISWAPPVSKGQSLLKGIFQEVSVSHP